MKTTELRLVTREASREHTGTGNSAPTVKEIELFGSDWLYDCQYRQHSPRTIDFRKIVLSKLVWFLKERGLNQCDPAALRQFFAYSVNGHNEPGGRWGNPQNNRPVRPRTVRDYHGALRTFFQWAVDQELLPSSPMARIQPPVHRGDQIQPFTDEQVLALIEACKKSRHPKRDEAILRIMLDTALRASELCAITTGDVDHNERAIRVRGKGNKYRTVYFGRNTGRAVWNYLREVPRNSDEPLFIADRGAGAGQPLTRSGLLQMFDRLGKAAGLSNVRCSPHTMRHYAAVSLIRGGMTVFTLQQFLGHTNLQQTSKYVTLAEADMQNQHRSASPGDRLKQRNNQ